MWSRIKYKLSQDGEEPKAKAKKEKEKKFACSWCGQAFTRKYDMEKHTRMHTGDKPYQCGICAKKFVQVGSLAVHMRGWNRRLIFLDANNYFHCRTHWRDAVQV